VWACVAGPQKETRHLEPLKFDTRLYNSSARPHAHRPRKVPGIGTARPVVCGAMSSESTAIRNAQAFQPNIDELQQQPAMNRKGSGGKSCATDKASGLLRMCGCV